MNHIVVRQIYLDPIDCMIVCKVGTEVDKIPLRHYEMLTIGREIARYDNAFFTHDLKDVPKEVGQLRALTEAYDLKKEHGIKYLPRGYTTMTLEQIKTLSDKVEES